MNSDLLPHLDTFAKAAELSSFTAAARALGLTQAAVSQRLQSLEQSLGLALFQRRGGRVLLTDAGRRLYPYAQRILALYMEARQEVTGQPAPVAGDLSLAASSVPGEHLLPAVLAAFRQQYPHVQVRATVLDSGAVLQQVEHGHVHLGLVGGKGDSPHLEFRPFASDRLVLVVPAGHALARRQRVSVDDFLRQPLVVREPGSGSRWCLEQGLASAGRSVRELQVVAELGSNEAIKEAVLHGLGVAVLSEQVVRQELQTERLHSLKVTDLPLERQVCAVWDRRRVLPIPARLFLDFLAPNAHAGSQS
jgi:DNA-binding transcriptional LysR family regulator